MSAATPVELHLPAGHFHFGGGKLRVHTLLGTCVAITLWHPIRRVGGICHFLLPSRGPRAAEPALPGLYADQVMQLFADALRDSRTQPQEYTVKIAGGGNMFPDHLMNSLCLESGCTPARQSSCGSIGCKNVSTARQLLAAAGYDIAAEHVGGRGSRQVIFDLSTGDVWVKRGAAMGAQVAA